MSKILKTILISSFLYSAQFATANEDNETETIEVTCSAMYCNDGGSSLDVLDVGTIGGSGETGGNNNNTPDQNEEQFRKEMKEKCKNWHTAEYDKCILDADSDADLKFRDCKIKAGLIDAFGNYIFNGSQEAAGELMLGCDTDRINNLRADKTICIAKRRNGLDSCVDQWGAD